MPNTPSGTRICPILMPVSIWRSPVISPIGSGMAASCSQPCATCSSMRSPTRRRTPVSLSGRARTGGSHLAGKCGSRRAAVCGTRRGWRARGRWSFLERSCGNVDGCGMMVESKKKAVRIARPGKWERWTRLPTAAQPASGSEGLFRALENLGSAIGEHPCREGECRVQPGSQGAGVTTTR